MADRQIRTILLVDSSASILFYLGMLLKRLEYKVATAQSAKDALRLMEETPPSIVLADPSLPDLRGVNFVKRIKESPRFKEIPVIILTSDVDPGVYDICMRMGCAAYLFKPVEPEALYRTLQAASESVPRANIRLSTTLKVIVSDGSVMGGAKRTEYATAISEGGLYVRTLQPQPRNALASLRLFLNDKEILAKAVVLYTCSVEGSIEEPGMGMKFVEISDSDRDLIRRFIKDQLTKDISSQ